MNERLSLNLLMLVFGALYIQPTLIFSCLLICNSIKMLSKQSLLGILQKKSKSFYNHLNTSV